MYKQLFISFLCLLFASLCSAQVYDGAPNDSSTIRFNAGTPPRYVADTAVHPLWQIGTTHKTFFATDTTGTTAIMTDTLSYYPPLADNSFIIKVHYTGNLIIDFWHRYQTDTLHAGGLVEFSLDTGLTWQNIKGDCNIDSSMGPSGGVLTYNCYTFSDTLFNGMPAFTGVKGITQYSRVQFFQGFPVKYQNPTASCSFNVDTIYLKFRFISDNTPDTLAGWIIDSIRIENDDWCCGGVVNTYKAGTLKIAPNPSFDGAFTFPTLQNEAEYTTEIYNAIGQRIYTQPYSQTLHLNNAPKGLYLYKVTNKKEYYSGQLLLE